MNSGDGGCRMRLREGDGRESWFVFSNALALSLSLRLFSKATDMLSRVLKSASPNNNVETLLIYH